MNAIQIYRRKIVRNRSISLSQRRGSRARSGAFPNSIASRGQIPYIGDGTGSTSGLFNANIPLFPSYAVYNGKMSNALSTIAFIHQGDGAGGGSYTAKQYNASRTYICFDHLGNDRPSPTEYYYCMRYD